MEDAIVAMVECWGVAFEARWIDDGSILGGWEGDAGARHRNPTGALRSILEAHARRHGRSTNDPEVAEAIRAAITDGAIPRYPDPA